MIVVLDSNVSVSALHFASKRGTPTRALEKVVNDDLIAKQIDNELVRILTENSTGVSESRNKRLRGCSGVPSAFASTAPSKSAAIPTTTKSWNALNQAMPKSSLPATKTCSPWVPISAQRSSRLLNIWLCEPPQTGGIPFTTFTPGGAVNTKLASGAATFGFSSVKTNEFVMPSVSSTRSDWITPSAAAVTLKAAIRFSIFLGMPDSVYAPLAA